ncbi:MAG TPA: SCO family protein [Burkholderiales bacterium]|nr:SCO family protein [Burkholderiales bacterium]
MSPRRRAWLVALALLLASCGGGGPWQLKDIKGVVPDLAFNLTDDSGRKVSAADYRGRAVLLFFGYTNCPDVCPTTLLKLSAALKDLGPAAQRAQVLFVTVDPERDTLEALHRYVRAFGPHVSGLRGSAAELRELAKRYRISYSYGTPDANGDYEVNHSSAVFVFDAAGDARLLVLPDSSEQAIAHDLKILLGAPQG